MYKQDYIMKMISEMVRVIAKIFFNRDYLPYELPIEENYTKEDYIYKDIMSLIDQGKINQAENLLFDELDINNERYMDLALDFYDRLNNFDDEFLRKHDFSRDEIKEGLLAISREFGVPLLNL